VRNDFDERAGITTDFIITDSGKERLSNLDFNVHRQIEEIAVDVVEEHEHMSTGQLVNHVHKQFGEYDLTQREKSEKNTDLRLDDFMDKESKSSYDKTLRSGKDI